MSRRNVRQRLALAAAVACVLGSAAAADAQLSVSVHGGHHPGGSIHFGSVPRPRVVAPVARVVPGSVRYGREAWVPPPGVRYRNPYAEGYFRRFRPGYFPVVIGGAQYYLYPTLPLGYQTVVVNGVSYYLYDGIYYQPYLYEGQTQYMVVPPPIP